MRSTWTSVFLMIVVTLKTISVLSSSDIKEGRQSNFTVNYISEQDRRMIDRSRQEFLDAQIQPPPLTYCLELDPDKILFMLYTREFPWTYVLNYNDEQSLIESSYNVNRQTKIIIHGWNQNGERFARKIKTAYLKKSDVNVISVDWSDHSNCDYYHTANNLVPKIAYRVAQMIRRLQNYGSPSDSFHLIGHSFGAHIAGLANQNLTGQQAPLVIGLDPAGYGFKLKWPTERLYSGDAYFVMVIHTNMYIAGLEGQIGNVDFYPNGGTFQPGCLPLDLLCGHERSVAYFTESILSEVGFYGIRCVDYKSYLAGLCSSNTQIIMSEGTPKTAKGRYYLKTNSVSPYATGKQRSQ